MVSLMDSLLIKVFHLVADIFFIRFEGFNVAGL